MNQNEESIKLQLMDIGQVIVNDFVEDPENQYGIWFSSVTCHHYPGFKHGDINLGCMFKFVGMYRENGAGALYRYVHHLRREPTAEEIFEAAGYGLTEAGFSWKTHETIHTTGGGESTFYFIITGRNR